jgi:hypothetical protein
MLMRPGLRKFMLSLHVATSVGWLGAVLAYVPLDVATVWSQDATTLRAAYVSMDLIAQWALIPLSIAALVTGLIVSLGTPWGLFRHYWVIVSLILTAFAVTILIIESQTIAALATIAADPATTDPDLRGLPNTLGHSIGGLVVLLVVLGLNVYKPRGLTKHGWRKQQEARGRPGTETREEIR